VPEKHFHRHHSPTGLFTIEGNELEVQDQCREQQEDRSSQHQVFFFAERVQIHPGLKQDLVFFRNQDICHRLQGLHHPVFLLKHGHTVFVLGFFSPDHLRFLGFMVG